MKRNVVLMTGLPFFVFLGLLLLADPASAGLVGLPAALERRIVPAASRPPCDCQTLSDSKITCVGKLSKLKITLDGERKEVTIERTDGKGPAQHWGIDFESYMIIPYDSAQLDLNGDGVTDTIVEIGLGGSGLAAENSIKLVFLSRPKGFDLWEISDFSSLKSSLCQLGPAKVTAYLHTDYTQVASCLDSKEHAFWVTQPIVFNGDGVKLDNSLDALFPLWMQFKYDVEKIPTTFLSPNMKRASLEDVNQDVETYYFHKVKEK